MNGLLMRTAAVACAVVLFTGCASSLHGNAGSKHALQRQLDQVAQVLAASDQPRVIYAGFALHSRSEAFASDVRAGARFARQLDPDAVLVTQVNPTLFGGDDEPLADRSNVEHALAELGRLARAQDEVVLLLSSHGAPNLLALNIGNRDDAPLKGSELRQWLQPLQGKPTLLLLSACFSGSLIDTLKTADRIILTAAARNRNSFGCNFEADGTWFIQGLLPTQLDLSQSLAELMKSARTTVAQREERLHVGLPSQPQAFVGNDVRTVYQTPLPRWREAPAAAPRDPGVGDTVK